MLPLPTFAALYGAAVIVYVLVSMVTVIVAPPGGVVNGPGPSVVLNSLVPPAGRCAGSIYVPASAEPMPNFPKQMEELIAAQTSPAGSPLTA